MYNSDWSDARSALLEAFRRLGYPDEFASEVIKNLGSPRAMNRMAAYLRNVQPQKVEMVVDEMFAIMEDSRSWRRKKEAEEANAAISMWYNSGRRGEDGQDER